MTDPNLSLPDPAPHDPPAPATGSGLIGLTGANPGGSVKGSHPGFGPSGPVWPLATHGSDADAARDHAWRTIRAGAADDWAAEDAMIDDDAARFGRAVAGLLLVLAVFVLAGVMAAALRAAGG